MGMVQCWCCVWSVDGGNTSNDGGLEDVGASGVTIVEFVGRDGTDVIGPSFIAAVALVIDGTVSTAVDTSRAGISDVTICVVVVLVGVITLGIVATAVGAAVVFAVTVATFVGVLFWYCFGCHFSAHCLPSPLFCWPTLLLFAPS